MDRAEELDQSGSPKAEIQAPEAAPELSNNTTKAASILPIIEPPKQLQDSPKRPTGVQKSTAGSASGGPIAGVPPGGQPTVGVPEEPTPGIPNQPAKVVPGNPEQPAQPQPPAVERITLSGTISISSWNGNDIRVDIFDGDQSQIGGKRPSVVANEIIKKPGNFSLRIPKGTGNYWIGAYVDQNGDGRPGKTDPSDWYKGNPVSATQSSSGIELQLDVPDDPVPR